MWTEATVMSVSRFVLSAQEHAPDWKVHVCAA
jgi:hypothetical protein